MGYIVLKIDVVFVKGRKDRDTGCLTFFLNESFILCRVTPDFTAYYKAGKGKLILKLPGGGILDYNYIIVFFLVTEAHSGLNPVFQNSSCH